MKRPPCLIYVMGPSGAGKTHLLDYARSKINGRLPVAFAHRYITRPRGNDPENYIALSHDEFALRKSRKLFAYDWTAYGFDYGIGVEIECWLKSGLNVVVDGSRAHFIAHRFDIAAVAPVLVTAAEDTLRQRLRKQQHDIRAIEARLERASKFTPSDLALITIDNSGSFEGAGDALVALLTERSQPT